ncbi:MAG: S1 RNA-binding domain-containing protein, partial [Bacteroidaceae bacterium]|nr:S1 RNA-binding domain-containing protein [Bacteroidaceae bacterium]
HRVSDPMQVVHLQQKVTVRVIDIDYERKRIALSMKGIKK